MKTNKEKIHARAKSWKPDKAVSDGASSYHDSVVKTSWHKKNIEPLTQILKKRIKKGELVVDFGAGTGASAVYYLNDIKKDFLLYLVDNSPSWLGKAYKLLEKKGNVSFFVLKKNESGYERVDEILGENVASHVVSANTVHLISEIESAFTGIFSILKKDGYFTFQSGNINRIKREEGILMIDDSVKMVHDRAIEIIRREKKFKKYAKELDIRIKKEDSQRKLIFPTPRDLEYYLEILSKVGFKDIKTKHVKIRVSYKDWLNFLRVRRLQAGILPEIGGKDPSAKEELERDELITMAAQEIFRKMEKENKYANKKSFIAEWTYVYSRK